MSIITIATSVVFALIFVGALLGFFRGWKKSLARLVTLLISLVASLLISPVISASFISKHVDGAVVTIFSKNINVEEALNNLSQDVQLGELFKSGSITNELIVAIVNIAINLLLFVVIFFLLQLFSLIVYWIICIVFKVRTRYDEKEEVEHDGKFWGLKILSVFLGILGSCTISFVMLTPVFGVMNVCDGFIAESENSEESASASSMSSFVCGGLYYTEDKNIGVIESYIQKYAEMKEIYDSSFIGKFMNVTRLSKAGAGAFEHLTTVKQGGLKLNLTHEVVHISKSYNKFKEIFVSHQFDFSENEDVDDLVEFYDEAVESEILKGYVVELLPQISDKWTNDEKFLGIENPLSGTWKEPINSTLVVFKIDNITRITNNFKALAGAIKIANNHEVIDRINSGDKIEDILNESDNFIKDEVIALTSTNELRDNISIILNEVFESLYSEVIGEDKSFEDNRLSSEEIHKITQEKGWSKEAQAIQDAINKTFEVYEQIKDDSSNDAVSEELEKIGQSIDYARGSKLISKPFKTFIVGFIQEKTDFKDAVKTKMIDTITNPEKWNDPAVNFAKTFKTIEETSKIAENLSGSENISFSELAPTLESIADDDATKGVLSDMINTGVIEDIAGETGSSTEVLIDVLEKFVTSENVDGSTVDKDVAAGEQIVNTVKNIENNGDMGLGVTEEERDANAEQLILDLISSKAMMELLDESSSSAEGSAITDQTKNISGADKSTLSSKISQLSLEAEEERILKAAFGIV